VFGARFDAWTAEHQRHLMWQRDHGWPNSLFKRLHGDNPHIKSCFRHMPLDAKACCRSVLAWHNDTMNIWTHLTAAIIYAAIAWHMLAILAEEGASAADLWHWTCVAAAFVVTWLCSAMYHTFRAHSGAVFTCTLICDLWGIVTTMFTFNYLTVSYELLCFPDESRVWHVVNFFGAALNFVLVPLLMRCDASSFRTFCWICFSALGGAVHVHRLQLTGSVTETTATGLLQTYALSAIGLLIRNVKLPERFAHAKYDLIGASHQIFHVVIALAPVPLLRAFLHEFRAGRLDPLLCGSDAIVRPFQFTLDARQQ
jgi:adiponectin receptor